MAKNVIRNILNKLTGVDSNLGISDSQTMQRLSDNLSLGRVIDNALPHTHQDRLPC